jgi:hypothetical protein
LKTVYGATTDTGLEQTLPVALACRVGNKARPYFVNVP